MVEVTLLTKPGCHLCDEARPVVERVVAGVEGASLVERSILESAELEARWSEDIPVVLIDGRPHSSWRVDPAKLEARLELRGVDAPRRVRAAVDEHHGDVLAPASLELGALEDRALDERRALHPGDHALDHRSRLVAEVASGLREQRDLDHAAILPPARTAPERADTRKSRAPALQAPAPGVPLTCGCDAGGASCEAACGASSSPCACGAS